MSMALALEYVSEADRLEFESYYCETISAECWMWLGYCSKVGYGQFRSKRFLARIAPRIAFLLSGKLLKPGQLVCHHCDNKQCVNPSHLYAGSYSDNNHDTWKRGGREGTFDYRGEKNPRVKLTKEQVIEIRRLRKLGYFLKDVAQRFNCSVAQVSSVATHRSWSHL